MNLFIKNSGQNKELLSKSKALLDSIIKQIEEAYYIKHKELNVYKDKTSYSIGIHSNENCVHFFKVDNNGLITFHGRDILHYEHDNRGKKNQPMIDEMLERFDTCQMNNDSHRFIPVITFRGQKEFEEVVKYICFALEADGFKLKR